MSEEIDFSADRLYPAGWGIIFSPFCAPKSWSPERVEETASREYPPGTSGGWGISEPDDEREGAFKGTNKIPCPDCEDRVHWLLNC